MRALATIARTAFAALVVVNVVVIGAGVLATLAFIVAAVLGVTL